MIHLESGEALNLQPKFIDVLFQLANAYPNVVSRQHLIDTVWDGNGYVGEKALTNAIWHLRQALKSADDGEVISTIRKSGYRLLLSPIFQTPAEPETVTLTTGEQTTSAIEPRHKWLYPLFSVALFVMLAVIVWQGFTPKPPSLIQRLSGDSFQVTSEPGLELMPSTSKDGRYLVYQWSPPGHATNLYRRDLSQPNVPANQITFDDLKQSRSVWSNDGKFLYLSRRDKETGQCDIVRLALTSLEESILGHCIAEPGPSYLDLNKDNRTLAYYGLEFPDKHGGIYLLDVTAQNAKPVRLSCQDCDYTDKDVAFSPSGKLLAVSRRKGRYSEDIYLLNLATGAEQQITKGVMDIVGFTWLATDDKLVYALQEADNRKGFLIDLASKQQYPLKFDGFSYPTYNPDTQTLFYQRRLEQYNIDAINLNDSGASAPDTVLQAQFNYKDADFSPATNKIAYLSNESGSYEIWSKSINGLEREKLTELHRPIYYPIWSHDGSKLAFMMADADSTSTSNALYVLDIATRRLTRVTSDYHRHDIPSWSYDDSALISHVFDAEKNGVYRFDLSSKTQTLMPLPKARLVHYLTQDTVLYSNPKHEIWLKNLSTGERTIQLKQNAQLSPYSWLATSEGIYYVTNDGDYHDINYLDLSSHQTQLIQRIQRQEESFRARNPLTLDTLNHRLLYTNFQFYQSDIRKITLQP